MYKLINYTTESMSTRKPTSLHFTDWRLAYGIQLLLHTTALMIMEFAGICPSKAIS